MAYWAILKAPSPTVPKEQKSPMKFLNINSTKLQAQNHIKYIRPPIKYTFLFLNLVKIKLIRVETNKVNNKNLSNEKISNVLN